MKIALVMGSLAPKSNSAESLPLSRCGGNAIGPVLAPYGRLRLQAGGPPGATANEGVVRLLAAFGRGSGHSLLTLGLDEVGTQLPPALAYWRRFANRYLADLCAVPGTADAAVKPAVGPPSQVELEAIAAAVPPMPVPARAYGG